jgi:A/G-specific adenine glycosylase
MSYYLKFMEAYPQVADLARAPVDEVLKHWQGLGYYTRARNLHETARLIQNTFQGEFPSDYQAIKMLKGIGDYTAAAIASICFGGQYPVLDGNVYRVMTRYLACKEPVNSSAGKRIVMEFLHKHMANDQPGDFNQALMELGAMVCTPKNPECAQCPLNQQCKANKLQNVTQFPVPALKKVSKIRYFNYLVIEESVNDRRFTCLYKREGEDIWKGLYEFPLIETDRQLQTADLVVHPSFRKMFPDTAIKDLALAWETQHILTHQKLNIRFFTLQFTGNNKTSFPAEWIKISQNEIHAYPVSRMTENFISQWESADSANYR